VLNSGSSSQKSALHEIQGALPVHPAYTRVARQNRMERRSSRNAGAKFQGANLKHRLKVESRRHAIEQLLTSLWTGDTLPFK